MSSNFAPHRIRARYLRALKSMPIPVSLADPPDPARLTVLGTEPVGDRLVHFGTVASAPRLWMALSGAGPAVEVDGRLLGYVTGLVVGEPDLWVCDGAHRDWVFDAANSRELKRAASRVWFSCVQDCEG
ncbi:hypothetical protein [Glycomyces tenuis]|uniref:hypothetical protein n=1 Tax=Glycomyces tenuis TaxID=58116 RepID=UPI0004103AA1|nr:hypothetical protein [Glycomyces tenuis]